MFFLTHFHLKLVTCRPPFMSSTQPSLTQPMTLVLMHKGYVDLEKYRHKKTRWFQEKTDNIWLS